MDDMNNPYTGGNPDQTPKKYPGLAIAAMVLGIVSVVFSCCYYYVSFPCAVLAIVFGIITLRKGPAGKGMCIAGIACGAVSLVLAVVMIVAGAALLAAFPSLAYELQQFS